jgi:hypothetical protein
MFRRKGLALVVACAAVACGGLVRAAETTTASSNTTAATGASAFSLNQPVMMDDAGAPPSTSRPLMYGLEKLGVGKTLEDANINIYGYVEGAYTYSTSNPPDLPGGPTNFLNGRAFDVQSGSPSFSQLDLTVERTVDTTKGKFDIGFRVEQIYGEDAAFIHSNGLTTYSPAKIGLARHPKVQYDLNQAYLDFAVPVGNGLDIRVGKWNTLLGYEVISPNGNALYSHSFLFTQLPFTHTGVLAMYNLTKEITVTGGFTRGWDQALKDVNGSLDVIGQIKYAKDKLTLYLNGISGPEQPSGTTSGWRTVLDFIGTYNYSDNLTLAANVDYGWEPQIDAGGTGQWYGAAVYAGYKLSDMFTINGRGEWFDDQDGSAPGTFTGAPNTYYEATLGVAITPFPLNNIGKNFVIRPEVRYDYADHATWDLGTDRDRFTAAVDAYFQF